MVKMGTVWDRTVEFLGDNLSLIVPIALLAILVPTSISASLAPLRAGGGGSGATQFVVTLLALAFAVAGLWGQLAIAALAIDPAIGRDAHRVATARLLPAIGVYVALFAAILLLLVPVGVLLFAGGVDFARLAAAEPDLSGLPGATMTVLAIYLFVLMVALVFVGARLAPLTPVIVAERRGPGAIARAFALSRGLTWALVGVILLYVVVAGVADLAARSVFGSVLGLLSRGEGPVTVASVITAIAAAAVQTGFTVLAAAFTARLYVAILRAHGAEPA